MHRAVTGDDLLDVGALNPSAMADDGIGILSSGFRLYGAVYSYEYLFIYLH